MADRRIGILIIPGTMGSVLKQEGKKVWPINYGSYEHYANTLTPVSKEVEPARLLITYQRLKLALQHNFPTVTEFIYDWRVNNIDHISLLKGKINSMDVDEVYIVAHSMGGIISKLCLNEYKDDPEIKKVKKLITLGTPWKGSMESVRTLLYGSRVPDKYLKFIDKEAAKKVCKHFPSVYQLLPTNDFLSRLKAIDCVPYFLNDRYFDEFDDFFQGVMHEEFSENHSFDGVFNDYYKLLHQDISDDVELHEIIGVGKPTIKIICENTRKEPYVYYDEGDGTVPLLSAYSNLSERENYFAYFVNGASHNGMPYKGEILTLIKDIIHGNEFHQNDSIFNDLDSAYYKKFSGYISKIACPVDISIRDNDGNIIYGNIETIDSDEIRDLMQTDYEVDDIGSTTYVIFNDNDETSIDNFNGLVIDAYDKGLTSISLEKYEDGQITERKAFKAFEIDVDLQAEFLLKEETEQSSLVLKKDGEIQKTLELDDVAIDEGQVELPSTSIDFSGEHLKYLDEKEVYIGKDSITLHVTDIVAGDFEPKQTHILINDVEYIIEDGSLNLDADILAHGKNEIEYFTIDEYDYTEKKKKVTLYYFHNVASKVEFLFKDQFYLVHLTEDAVYSRVASAYGLQGIKPDYNFKNTEGVAGYQVVYHGIDREVEIKYVDFFGEEASFHFIIDEKIAKKIVKGSAAVSDVEKFVEKLNLEDVKYQFRIKQKVGNHKVLNDIHLSKCHALEISSETSFVQIIKNVELDVSFETSSEHISINSDIENYDFIFKVLDIDQQYVLDLELTSRFTFTIDEGPQKENREIVENFEVEYLPGSGSYKLVLALKNLKELLSGYWKPENKILGIAKLEIISVKNSASIRSMNIKIAQ
ncbi:TPA: alpha/beta hydrolase [Bacillus cereus]|uniref:Alpha/beta hydrolase n=1 Tax=Bacillus thuringiensis TaxID=1428 RepID=A0AAW9JFI2_BACTU|nr:alpha/beta hydrolase [Bacillus thuringiensis]MDZ5475487.1 alpha/beta hydrolase [Bacillus thuringiensis]MRB36255.1 alpha/beta hydrolase [Bacillus thuringiensis]HDR8452933.1 alpha/beta hydrolase [Bacillus cereus]HDR8463716.1 alpha/beta hydrolase [Bacillus cereus]